MAGRREARAGKRQPRTPGRALDRSAHLTSHFLLHILTSSHPHIPTSLNPSILNPQFLGSSAGFTYVIANGPKPWT